MALTLGDLRTYCREIASPDSAGTTAEREFNVWINAALARVYMELEWDKLQHQATIPIEIAEEYSSDLTLVLGSSAVYSAGGNLLAKYVTEEWDMVVDGESQRVFRLGTFTDVNNATMRTGDRWSQASAAGKSVTFAKTKYSLPDNAFQVQRVQVLQSGAPLARLTPEEFDRQKAFNATLLSGHPRFYTLRDETLEVWPHPGTTYVDLGISYRKGPTIYTVASLDSAEIEWPVTYADLIYKAILLEAAITQGEDSPVPYPVALREFDHRLGRFKNLDSDRRERAGPMSLRLPTHMPMGQRSISWQGPIVDD